MEYTFVYHRKQTHKISTLYAVCFADMISGHLTGDEILKLRPIQ